jgi:hypothetical protein
VPSPLTEDGKVSAGGSVLVRPIKEGEESEIVRVSRPLDLDVDIDMWRRRSLLNPHGVFVLFWDGKIAGAVNTASFEICDKQETKRTAGWIGLIVADVRKQPQVIMSKLLHHAIEYLREEGAEIILRDTHPTAVNEMEMLGFRTLFPLRRWEKKAPKKLTSSTARVLRSEEMEDLLNIDREFTGLDRRDLVGILAESATLQAVAYDENDRFGGYLIARSLGHFFRIGPWLARNETVAEKLFGAALSRCPLNSTSVLDVPESSHAEKLLHSAGFRQTHISFRMCMDSGGKMGLPHSGIYATSGSGLI